MAEMNKKCANVVWKNSLITQQDRQTLNEHKSFVL